MDSMDLEREEYDPREEHRGPLRRGEVNIVDTPRHADFGGGSSAS
jgi:predicted membrane GTPase involved in stress response